MREMEFLPSWYPMIRRGRRLVAVQGYVALFLVGAIGLWQFLSHHNVQTAEASLVHLNGELQETNTALRKLDELLGLKQHLQQRNEIIARLGMHVEATRMLKAIEDAMPAEMALLNVAFETEELKAASGLAAARAAQQPEQPVERRLKVRLVGVAPTDVDLAEFLHKLSNMPFFEQVAMTYARERTDGDRMMREFEVTFSLSLTGPAGG